MTAKIVRLTPAQEIDLVAHRDAWRAIGTRAGHDQECEVTGRAAVVDAYKGIGVEPPTLVLWAQSPLQALLMHWALRGLLDKEPDTAPVIDTAKSGSLLRDQLRDQLGDQLWGQLGDQLGDQLRGQLWGQLWDQLGDQLGGQLGDQLRDQLGDQLWGQLWGQLRDQLGGQLGGQLGDQLRGQLQEAYNQTWCWGQCEGYWTSWVRFAISIGVKVTDEQERRLQIMEQLARSAFMVLSWRGVTILVQHPIVARFDSRHRLHRTDGPALAWPDGYAVHAISGIRQTPERGAAMVAGRGGAPRARYDLQRR
jgi:hypothetical protein